MNQSSNSSLQAPATTTSQTGKRSSLLLSSPHNIIPPRINILPKLNIKVEAGTNSFSLPPTPPSYSGSEDSEDNGTISQPSSPAARKTTTRMIMNHHTSTRQPINTPLISSQPVCFFLLSKFSFGLICFNCRKGQRARCCWQRRRRERLLRKGIQFLHVCRWRRRRRSRWRRFAGKSRTRWVFRVLWGRRVCYKRGVFV